MVCNVLLLGQTGVGKSALLNYLAGEELAESGISSSTGGVTRGVNKYTVVLNGQRCMISDSEGLELQREDEWKYLVDNELFSAKETDSLSSWYHIIIFCIGANSSRVQDYELEIISKILEKGYSVIVAFTKADLATEDELSAQMQAVRDYFGDGADLIYIPVCSRKRRNNVLEGKEEICSSIIDSWERTLLNRLPSFVYSPIYDNLSKWNESTASWLSQQKIGLFNRRKSEVQSDLDVRIKRELEKLDKKVSKRQKAAFNEVSKINQALGQALDMASLLPIESPTASKFQQMEFAFAEGFTEGTKATLLGGLGGLAVAVTVISPLVRTLVSLGSIVASGLLGKSAEELFHSYRIQYTTMVKLYSEREELFGFLLADSLGYYYGTREMAICYLKGRGVSKNAEEFSNKIKEVKSFIEEYEIEDGRGEYYIAYDCFSKHTPKLKAEGKRWLSLAAKHGYDNAKRVLKFGEIFPEMEQIEADEEAKLLNYWYVGE